MLMWSGNLETDRRVIGEIYIEYFDIQQYNDAAGDSVEYYTKLPEFSIPAPPQHINLRSKLVAITSLGFFAPLSIGVWLKILKYIRSVCVQCSVWTTPSR